MEERVKSVRLRDITLKHLKGINPNVGIDNFEEDLIMYFKNFLMTAEEMDAQIRITQC